MAITNNIRVRVRNIMKEIEEERRQEELRKLNATNDTVKESREEHRIEPEKMDRSEEYKRVIMEFELEQQILRQKKLKEELNKQANERDRAMV